MQCAIKVLVRCPLSCTAAAVVAAAVDGQGACVPRRRAQHSSCCDIIPRGQQPGCCCCHTAAQQSAWQPLTHAQHAITTEGTRPGLCRWSSCWQQHWWCRPEAACCSGQVQHCRQSRRQPDWQPNPAGSSWRLCCLLQPKSSRRVTQFAAAAAEACLSCCGGCGSSCGQQTARLAQRECAAGHDTQHRQHVEGAVEPDTRPGAALGGSWTAAVNSSADSTPTVERSCHWLLCFARGRATEKLTP